jgi:hypothetical protein
VRLVLLGACLVGANACVGPGLDPPKDSSLNGGPNSQTSDAGKGKPVASGGAGGSGSSVDHGTGTGGADSNTPPESASDGGAPIDAGLDEDAGVTR